MMKFSQVSTFFSLLWVGCGIGWILADDLPSAFGGFAVAILFFALRMIQRGRGA